MDELSKAISEKIEESNAKGEDIYLKKLTEIFRGSASIPTIHKRIRQLVDDGNISERMVQSGRGIYKLLYVPGYGEKIYDSEKLDTIIMMQKEMLNIMKTNAAERTESS